MVSDHMTALYILPYSTLMVLRCSLGGLLLKPNTVVLFGLDDTILPENNCETHTLIEIMSIIDPYRLPIPICISS